MKRIMLATLAAALLAGVAPAHADWRDYFSWEAFIWMDDGSEEAKIRIGASDRATDGYDALYESDAFFAGYLRPYFYHPEWDRSSAPGGTDYFFSDIRSDDLPQGWDFYVTGYRTGRNVVVTWDLAHLRGEGCTSVELALTDMKNGQTVVMTETATDAEGNEYFVNPSYTYYNADRSPHHFTVAATGVATSAGSPPAGLRVNPGSGQVVLHWDAEADAGYRVYRDGELASGEELITDEDGDGTAVFVDRTAPRGNRGGGGYTAEYSVTAVGEDGCESEPATVDVSR